MSKANTKMLSKSDYADAGQVTSSELMGVHEIRYYAVTHATELYSMLIMQTKCRPYSMQLDSSIYAVVGLTQMQRVQ